VARDVIGWPAGRVGPAMAAPGNQLVSDSETVAAAADPADPAAAVDAIDPGWAVLARVAAGDSDAFELLVEAHQVRLLRLCERMLGDAE
jgi:hypothetical protein